MSRCIGSTLSNTTNNSCPFEGSLEKMRKQKSRISCLKRLFHEDLKDGKWKLKVLYRKLLSYLVLLYPKHNILDLLSYENVFSFFFSNNMEKVLRSEIELCCFSFILKRGKQWTQKNLFESTNQFCRLDGQGTKRSLPRNFHA